MTLTHTRNLHKTKITNTNKSIYYKGIWAVSSEDLTKEREPSLKHWFLPRLIAAALNLVNLIHKHYFPNFAQPISKTY